jgi:hypothetical protein
MTLISGDISSPFSTACSSVPVNGVQTEYKTIRRSKFIRIGLLDLQKLAGLPIRLDHRRSAQKIRGNVALPCPGPRSVGAAFTSFAGWKSTGDSVTRASNPSTQRRRAAFYAAKYAGRSLEEIHFGGTPTVVDLSECARFGPEGCTLLEEKCDVSPLAQVPDVSCPLMMGRKTFEPLPLSPHQ